MSLNSAIIQFMCWAQWPFLTDFTQSSFPWTTDWLSNRQTHIKVDSSPKRTRRKHVEDEDQPEIRVLLMTMHLFIEQCLHFLFLFFQAGIICVPKLLRIHKFRQENIHEICICGWPSLNSEPMFEGGRSIYNYEPQLWSFSPQFVLKKSQWNPANIRNVSSGLSVTMADWPAVKGILASEWSFILTCPLKLCSVHTPQILKLSLNKLA